MFYLDFFSLITTPRFHLELLFCSCGTYLYRHLWHGGPTKQLGVDGKIKRIIITSQANINSRVAAFYFSALIICTCVKSPSNGYLQSMNNPSGWTNNLAFCASWENKTFSFDFTELLFQTKASTLLSYALSDKQNVKNDFQNTVISC